MHSKNGDEAGPMREPAELTRPRLPLSELPPRDWAAAGEALERDGVVMLKGALTPAAFDKVEAAVEWSLANPTPGAVRFYPNEPARFFEDRGYNHSQLVRDIG